MPRRNGSYFGLTVNPTPASASGIWRVREAEEYLRVNKWPATPGVPGSPIGTAGNGQVALTWSAPTLGSPPTDYEVQYSSNAGSTWTTFTDGVGTATSATVTGLTNGTGYIFRVRALNALGEGPYGSASGTVTPAALASIPTMTSATAPSGEASASAILAEGLEAWRAFDKEAVSGDTTFYASPVPPAAEWLQYDFGSGQSSTANGYTIHSRAAWPYGNSQAPFGWTVSGSNDGTTFTEIDSRSGVNDWFYGGSEKSFNFAATQTWRFWRWTWTDAGSENVVVLPKVQLTA